MPAVAEREVRSHDEGDTEETVDMHGAAEVEALLQQGPTTANMARVKEFGVLPEQSRNPLDYLEDGLDGLRTLTSIPNIIGRAATLPTRRKS